MQGRLRENKANRSRQEMTFRRIDSKQIEAVFNMRAPPHF